MVIKLRSNILPAIEIDTADNSTSGVGGFLGSLIQPSVEYSGIEYAPYGPPALPGVGLYIIIFALLILGLRKVKL